MSSLHIVLVEPEIPQNTGNIARTCACTGASLHLVGPLGFSVSDRQLKRAGLDYWHMLDIHQYPNLGDFMEKHGDEPLFFFTTKGRRRHVDAAFPDDAWLVFGKETAGLPEELLAAHPSSCLRIPMRSGARSMNLSNSVAIAVFEVLRQRNFEGLEDKGKLHRLSWPDGI